MLRFSNRKTRSTLNLPGWSCLSIWQDQPWIFQRIFFLRHLHLPSSFHATNWTNTWSHRIHQILPHPPKLCRISVKGRSESLESILVVITIVCLFKREEEDLMIKLCSLSRTKNQGTSINVRDNAWAPKLYWHVDPFPQRYNLDLHLAACLLEVETNIVSVKSRLHIPPDLDLIKYWHIKGFIIRGLAQTENTPWFLVFWLDQLLHHHQHWAFWGRISFSSAFYPPYLSKFHKAP